MSEQQLTKAQTFDINKTRPKVLKTLIKRFYRQAGDKRNIEKSRNWFWQKAVKLGKIRNSQIFAGGYKLKTKPTIGKLYYYQYNAEHKVTLPHWDMFPLVFPFNIYKHNSKTYMTGINLHYLPPKLRSILFANLLAFKNEKRYRESTRLQIEWGILKVMSQHKLLRPCVKSYLLDKDHILSRFVEIPSTDWEIVVPLNISRFQKESQNSVWSQYNKK